MGSQSCNVVYAFTSHVICIIHMHALPAPIIHATCITAAVLIVSICLGGLTACNEPVQAPETFSALALALRLCPGLHQ